MKIGIAADHAGFNLKEELSKDLRMNMICLGGRVIGYALAWEMIQTFLGARFTGEERHRRRLKKIEVLEREGRRGG